MIDTIKPWLRFLPKRRLAAALACNLLFVLLSVFSLSLVLPLMDLLLNAGGEASRAAAAGGPPLLGGLKSALYQAAGWVIRGGDKRHGLAVLCGVLAAGFALKNLFSFLSQYHFSRAGLGFTARLHLHLAGQAYRLSLPEWNRLSGGQWISQCSADAEALQEGLFAALLSLAQDPALILFYLALAFTLSWPLALATLAGLPLCGWGIITLARRLQADHGERLARRGTLQQQLITFFQHFRTVKVFDQAQSLLARYRALYGEYWRRLGRLARRQALSAPLTETLGAAVAVGILWLGGTQVLRDRPLLTPGGFFLFMGAVLSLIQPVKNLGQAGPRWAQFRAAARRLAPAAAPGAAPSGPGAARSAIDFKEIIEARDLYFSFGGPDLFRGLSLCIRRGEWVAVGGPSGAGKSTLADLLLGLLAPRAGAIRADGRPLAGTDLEHWRRQFAVAYREAHVFSASLRFNLALGRPGAGRADVEAASRAAGLHPLAAGLPEGYDTPVGSGGLPLSGGQQARVALARAFLSNRPVLVLDEVLSSLDPASQERILEELERRKGTQTIIMISHQREHLARADRAYWIEHGVAEEIPKIRFTIKDTKSAKVFA